MICGVPYALNSMRGPTCLKNRHPPTFLQHFYSGYECDKFFLIFFFLNPLLTSHFYLLITIHLILICKNNCQIDYDLWNPHNTVDCRQVMN